MKFQDLLRMSSSNLWKRKVRTILTVLGVVIGVASIVVMISLGLGLSRSLMEQYESYGSLTEIEVNAPYYMEDATEPPKLDDALIEELEGLEHVEAVHPILSTSVLAIYGGYQNYLNVQGCSIESLESMGIEVGEGSLPSASDGQLKFFYGSSVIRDFYNPKTQSGYWMDNEMPDIDLMKDPMFVIFDTDAYYSAGGMDESGQVIAQPKKYLIETCGVEASPGENEWSRFGWNTYCDIDQLVPMLKKVFKNKVIPGQPTMSSGKPYKEIFYSQLLVDVDNMDNVAEVQTYITDKGYYAYSQAQWIESDQQTMGTIQIVLGGIGAVSLFVAAIGITNTMMMSIYERTKEIGIMKVLGCDLRNIRSLFLMEAGYIGFIGGVVGLILSYTLSFAINRIVSQMDEYLTSISYIPFWLAGLSLVFAIFVGMAAGFFPALRAMRLSALSAIRNE